MINYELYTDTYSLATTSSYLPIQPAKELSGNCLQNASMSINASEMVCMRVFECTREIKMKVEMSWVCMFSWGWYLNQLGTVVIL